MAERKAMAAPLFGTTREAHVRQLMADVEAATSAVFARIKDGAALRQAEREALGRRLAGVVGDCETIRIWLGAGAPR